MSNSKQFKYKKNLSIIIFFNPLARTLLGLPREPEKINYNYLSLS